MMALLGERSTGRANLRRRTEDRSAFTGDDSRTATTQRACCHTTFPSSFICPITRELMHDPVATVDGHCFERKAISMWLQNHDTSPVTGARLPHPQLLPIHPLRCAISEWMVANKLEPPGQRSTNVSKSGGRLRDDLSLIHI